MLSDPQAPRFGVGLSFCLVPKAHSEWVSAARYACGLKYPAQRRERCDPCYGEALGRGFSFVKPGTPLGYFGGTDMARNYSAEELDNLLELGVIEDYQLSREDRALVNAYRAAEDAKLEAWIEEQIEASMQ